MFAKKMISVFFLLLAIAIGIQYYYQPASFDNFVSKAKEKFEEFGFYQKKEVNVAIIGGGLAGLSSATELVKLLPRGSKVTLFDKNKNLGGNSAKATSGINAISTRGQKLHDVSDDFDTFYADTVKSCGKDEENHPSCNVDLVKILVKDSTDAVKFLEENNLDLSFLSQLGGHSNKRTHRCDPNKIRRNVGGEIVHQLILKLRELEEESTKDGTDRIKIRLNTRVTKIEHEGKKLAITTENTPEKEFFDFVVVTTGGFGANSELVKKHKPEFEGFPTTNGEFAEGDGLIILENMNAQLEDLSEIQIHPTGMINPEKADTIKVFLAPEAMRGLGGLLFNQKGERFVDELQTRDYVSKRIMEECEDIFNVNRRIAVLVLNKATAEKFGVSKLGFYKSQNLVRNYKNIDELCTGENFDCENVKDAIINYQKAFNGEQKDVFGKRIFPTEVSLDDEFSAIYITPSLHYTMGGTLINDKAQVIDKSGSVIKGLYAAGEVTGKIHGKNRLGGNSLLECVVFGRIAAKSIISEV